MVVAGDDFSLRFDGEAAASPPGRSGDHESAREPVLRLNIWRAPTDNDDNTWGDQRAAIRWREAGLDQLAEHVDGVDVSPAAAAGGRHQRAHGHHGRCR